MRTIVCISGTSRPNNYTARALAVVEDELSARGVEVVAFDAREMTLGFPGQPATEDAVKLREAVKACDGVVLATPEYHGTFAAMAKLIIENLEFPSALRGKPMALLGVAAGRIGAVKSLEQLKGVCSHVGALAVPGAISIAGVRSVFDDDGNCTDDATEKVLRGLAGSLTDFIQQYVCPAHYMEEMVRGEAKPWTTAV